MQLGSQADDYAVATQQMINEQLPGMPDWYTLMYPSGTMASPMPAPTGVTPVSASSGGTNWAAIVQQLAQAGISAYQITQLSNLNQQLISQGRPPLSASQAAAMAPQLNFGISGDTQNLLIYGALGIGAIVLLSSVMKSKR